MVTVEGDVAIALIIGNQVVCVAGVIAQCDTGCEVAVYRVCQLVICIKINFIRNCSLQLSAVFEHTGAICNAPGLVAINGGQLVAIKEHA